MKKLIIYLAFFGILIFFTSCANQTRFINPDYSNKQINHAILLLSQFENADFIKDEKLFNELDIYHTKEKYYLHFIENFEKHLDEQSTFERIEYISYQTQPEYERRTLDLNQKEKFTFDLPPHPVQLDISEPVFILFLEDLLLSFSKKTKEATTSTRSYNVSGLREEDAVLQSKKNFKYYINLKSNYVIYDNSTGELVSYGNVSSSERYTPPTPVINSINRIMKEFIGNIFKETPFEKQK
ncbi:MAG: hypothetical protein R6V04_09645 [bacterium]